MWNLHFASGPRTRLYARALMATWRVTPIMVATGDWGRIARVIASLRVHTRLLLVDAWRFRLRDRDLSRDRSVTTYFLRGDACRLFLFLSKLTAKASDCVCKDVTQSSFTSCRCISQYLYFFLPMRIKDQKVGQPYTYVCAECTLRTVDPTHFIRIYFFAWHAYALLCLACIIR